MSLIHKALERANATIHTASAERKVQEEARRLRDKEYVAEEEKQLETVEKEVKKQRALFVISSVSGYIIAGVVIGALLAGSITLIFWMSSFQKTEENSETQPEQKVKVMVPMIADTKPAVSPAKKRYQLSGITTSGGEKMALINNQIVTAGTQLADRVVVKSIAEKTVILEDHGREKTLSL